MVKNKDDSFAIAERTQNRGAFKQNANHTGFIEENQFGDLINRSFQEAIFAKSDLAPSFSVIVSWKPVSGKVGQDYAGWV